MLTNTDPGVFTYYHVVVHGVSSLRGSLLLRSNFINREQCRAGGESGSFRDLIEDMFTAVLGYSRIMLRKIHGYYDKKLYCVSMFIFLKYKLLV